MGLRVGFDAVRALGNSTGLGNYSRRVLAGLRAADPALDLVLYSPPPRWKAWGLRSYWRSFRLGRQAAQDRVELYHGLSHEIPRDLPRTGIPSVVSFLDLLWVRFPGLFRRPDRASYEWRYRWSAEHAGAIVAVSQQTRRDLLAYYGVDPARVTVIPPPADPRYFATVPEPARREVLAELRLPERLLLCVGTLEPRKNQRTAIAALAELDPKLTPALVLVGQDRGSAAELTRLAERAGVADRVHIRTAVPDGALPALMQSATVFLYPSLFEGFGLPIVEALSAGVPVITSEGGCFPEAGGPDTIYVPATDAVALASQIRRVLDDPALAAGMREKGRDFARRFDSGALAARMLHLYQAVRAGRKVREEASRCAG